jgi:hypothetical protein
MIVNIAISVRLSQRFVRPAEQRDKFEADPPGRSPSGIRRAYPLPAAGAAILQEPVTGRKPAVVLELTGQRYDRIVVTMENPDEIAASLT